MSFNYEVCMLRAAMLKSRNYKYFEEDNVCVIESNGHVQMENVKLDKLQIAQNMNGLVMTDNKTTTVIYKRRFFGLLSPYHIKKAYDSNFNN